MSRHLREVYQREIGGCQILYNALMCAADVHGSMWSRCPVTGAFFRQRCFLVRPEARVPFCNDMVFSVVGVFRGVKVYTEFDVPEGMPRIFLPSLQRALYYMHGNVFSMPEFMR